MNSHSKMSLPLALLERLVKSGTLRVVLQDGSKYSFGTGEPSVTWKVRRKSALQRILRNPFLNLGESYMNKEWSVEDNRLSDLLYILRSNTEKALASRSPLTVIPSIVQSWNNIKSSLRNVAHHYDLSDELFRSFLDEDLHYSCAYFARPDMTLDEAQQAKCAHIAKKLCLPRDARVLDIGSGWGSLAMYLAQNYEVSVTGITLSQEQLKVSQRRAIERNLGNRVQFQLEDYREHDGQYDAVVSVGMFEHVGKKNFQTFFNKVKSLIKPDGIALVHTIGSFEPPAPTNPWIKKYIFPGGYIPSLSELAASIEKSGLIFNDVEVWRRHYAETLKEWNRRFQACREKFVRLYDEKFCRMWEFYLCASQTSFELATLLVYQLQLGHRNDSAPITRDYLYS